MLDLIILAAIAFSIFWKLWNKLGQEDEDKPSFFHGKKAMRVVSPQNTEEHEAQQKPSHMEMQMTQKMRDFFESVRLSNPTFTFDTFLAGAKKAYEILTMAIIKKNFDDMKNLMTPELYHTYKDNLSQNPSHYTFIGFNEVKAQECWTANNIHHITLFFESEQIRWEMDADQNIISGNPKKVIKLQEVWTFVRDAKSTKLSWQVSAIKQYDSSNQHNHP